MSLPVSYRYMLQRHPRPVPSYEDLTFEQVIERLEELANPRPPGEPNGHQRTAVVPAARSVRELVDSGWALLLKDRSLVDMPGPARAAAATRLLELAQFASARLGKPETGSPANGDD